MYANFAMLAGVACAQEWCSEAGCWPRVWLLGGQKCGSTAMFSMLSYTMELRGAEPPPTKETHFWDWAALQKRNYSLPDFLKLFPRANGLEGTPNHLSTPLVPGMLARAMIPSVRTAVKLIAVLREPIARELSLYNHERALGFDWDTDPGVCSASGSHAFEDFAACQLEAYGRLEANISQYDDAQRKLYLELSYGIWNGLYVAHIDAWRRSFSRRQLYLVSYDAMSEPTKMATDVAKFLGLFPLKRQVWLPVRNANNNTKKQRTITCDIRDDLHAVFQPWNARLYETLREDLEQGLAPEHEPAFPEFKLHPCGD
ncbi:hypothetical protein CTAYLR_005897 [Chrysophaeum taylorii]|uniref:Sulfotransferase domain-containing protein n=1 Tax=Chrysophaeum taylorii TaxID=2483200 RepID=A0AAD7XKI3_9STRA|nr:hypothetical protein CTAYLR_005870 [Chrysophaeum taylorii]KAJ8614326.1 hypothetical protein CTAYLR_005897 [Chrysophaeum taylorii]